MIRVMKWSRGLCTDLLAFALQLRKPSARRPSDEGALRPVIASNRVPSLQMKSVGSHSTSWRDEEGRNVKDGVGIIWKCGEMHFCVVLPRLARWTHCHSLLPNTRRQAPLSPQRELAAGALQAQLCSGQEAVSSSTTTVSTSHVTVQNLQFLAETFSVFSEVHQVCNYVPLLIFYKKKSHFYTLQICFTAISCIINNDYRCKCDWYLVKTFSMGILHYKSIYYF